MNCAKCGLELPESARHCPNCGTVNELVSSRLKAKPIVYVVLAVALVIGASLIVYGVMTARGNRNVTAAPSAATPPGNITTAPPGNPSQGNVVSAPSGTPAPAATGPAAAPKPKPPQGVVDYLNFVKQVEEHRQKLLNDTGEALLLSSAAGQTKSLLALIEIASEPNGQDAWDPLKESKKELLRQYKNWLSTLQYFDSRTAPDPCREFSGAYRQVLYLETKAIGEIAAGFSKVNIMDPKDMEELLSRLQKMKRDPSIQANIDQAADTADAALSRLVSNYDMPKPFDVPREKQTGGSIMGF